MESLDRRACDVGDKEILYSKTIRAGRRIYYMDVKRNMRDDMFVAITESKKVQERDTERVVFEKHKIFLYKEDFDRFINSLVEVVSFIRSNTEETEQNDTERSEAV
ncbi:MAG: PUR family DNA/RNA-binding protein [Tannerellaceae bacterium]|jgi:hypothetical protein|nr:PUR family DNA/RNA-binding protein [Tannerellaceae bacterium]